MTLENVRSETELQAMLDSGVIREGHALDVKREYGPKSNPALATDMAAMALDGGCIVIGVDEVGAGKMALSPVSLQGLKERVAQVASMGIDPPLIVQTNEVPSALDDGRGYLVVIVPQSPLAPHMVDGKYRGRADSTNRVLSDAEVVRLHATRKERRQEFSTRLAAEVDRDPMRETEDDSICSHLFVLLQPLADSGRLLLDAARGTKVDKWLEASLRSGSVGGRANVSPDLHEGGFIHRRAKGWSIHSYDLDESRRAIPAARQRTAYDLEVDEDGTIHTFLGSASLTVYDSKAIFEEAIFGFTKRALLLALHISQSSGYRGAWMAGVALTDLEQGRSAHAITHTDGRWAIEVAQRTLPSYSERDMSEVTQTTVHELEVAMNDVLDRLLGQLNRALGGLFDPATLPF